jgi:hypothetical protein
MTKIHEAIETLTNAINMLEKYKDCDAKKPEKGKFYKTFNDSVVFIYESDDWNEAQAVVLKGGHGISTRSGSEPVETYSIDDDGYVTDNEPGIHMMMGLAEKLDIEI